MLDQTAETDGNCNELNNMAVAGTHKCYLYSHLGECINIFVGYLGRHNKQTKGVAEKKCIKEKNFYFNRHCGFSFMLPMRDNIKTCCVDWVWSLFLCCYLLLFLFLCQFSLFFFLNFIFIGFKIQKMLNIFVVQCECQLPGAEELNTRNTTHCIPTKHDVEH